jgi:pSer/pThr/pTyr-binding forkhead associated (FHA) protein
MPVFLEVLSGAHKGLRIEVNAGQVRSIGRTTRADLAFSDDTYMSGVHFSVEYDGKACRLTDLNSSNGTSVNGQAVQSAVLGDGNTIVAGGTTFLVRFGPEGAAAPRAAAVLNPVVSPQERLLALLRGDFQPLFAVLDAARDPRILALLMQHQEEYISLYEGAAGAKFVEFAPYLVRLEQDSRLLEILVKEGWGNSWGVYLTSASDIMQVRHHLRHFLEVGLPNQEQVYFRFYDPRVLRVFVPTCTSEEAKEFFGPIQNYLAEDEGSGTLLQFMNSIWGSETRRISLFD